MSLTLDATPLTLSLRPDRALLDTLIELHRAAGEIADRGFRRSTWCDVHALLAVCHDEIEAALFPEAEAEAEDAESDAAHHGTLDRVHTGCVRRAA